MGPVFRIMLQYFFQENLLLRKFVKITFALHVPVNYIETWTRNIKFVQ
jgi:hypothetical protein